MTKWIIYSKDDKPLHESITEYNSDGEIVYQDTFEYMPAYSDLSCSKADA
jgi:hypothetical protein